MALYCSKKLSASSRGITSKNNGDFYCLICLHSFRIKNRLESHKKVCVNKDSCNTVIPSEGCKILGFDQYQKSDTFIIYYLLAPFIIYADLECLIE